MTSEYSELLRQNYVIHDISYALSTYVGEFGTMRNHTWGRYELYPIRCNIYSVANPISWGIEDPSTPYKTESEKCSPSIPKETDFISRRGLVIIRDLFNVSKCLTHDKENASHPPPKCYFQPISWVVAHLS